MDRRNGTIPAVDLHHGFHAVEFGMVFPTLEGGNHLFHQVVDVEQFHVHVRVVHLDGQVVRDVVAEGGHGAVVVRAAPLAEKVRETVNQNARAGLFAIFKKQFLPRLFAATVFAVAEAARQSSLDAAAEHHRALVAVTFQGIKQSAREPEVSGHELAVVLRAVHACQIKHEIRLGAVFIQLLGRGVNVVFKNFTYNEVAAGTVLAVADVLERRNQVTPYKTFCACY